MPEKTWFITGTSRGFGREWAVAALERLKPLVDACDPFQLELLEAQMNAALQNNGSVKSAVSAARSSGHRRARTIGSAKTCPVEVRMALR